MNELEIKLKVLEIAKDISINSYFNKKEIERLNWEVKANYADNIGKTINKLELHNNFPDESEVIKKAKIFNDFIFS
jgi:hypothetical protein